MMKGKGMKVMAIIMWTFAIIVISIAVYRLVAPEPPLTAMNPAVAQGPEQVEPTVPPMPGPMTITVAFEREVWALPVGVDIIYPPGVSNQDPMVILSTLPARFLTGWSNKVTTAMVVNGEEKQYLGVAVSAPETPIGVRWYLVLLEDHLVELERLDAPLRHIEMRPILP